MWFCYLELINKNNDFQLQTQNHITFSFKALVSIFFVEFLKLLILKYLIWGHYSLHAKGRKRKTINPPWEHAEDMNLPGSADCQPKPPRACSILPLSSWPFPLPLLEGKGSRWGGAGCRTWKGTVMGYSENVSSWWQQSWGLHNVNQRSRRKCNLRSPQDAIFSRVPSQAGPLGTAAWVSP